MLEHSESLEVYTAKTSNSQALVNAHLLVLLRAIKQRKKNTAPKAIRIRKEVHGKGCPRTEARRHRQACVSGERLRMMLNAVGTWLKEKNVPLRKAMGKTTKLINKVMS